VTGSRALSFVVRAALLVAIAAACAPVDTESGTVERLFAERRSNVEVTVDGAVTRLLTDDAGPSGTHQRFIIQVAAATQTLLVDNNVDIGKRAPVAVGDTVRIRGEYVWNSEGGLVHFTHHDPQRTHEDGFIELRGVRYSRVGTLWGVLDSSPRRLRCERQAGCRTASLRA